MPASEELVSRFVEALAGIAQKTEQTPPAMSIFATFFIGTRSSS